MIARISGSMTVYTSVTIAYQQEINHFVQHGTQVIISDPMDAKTTKKETTRETNEHKRTGGTTTRHRF